MEPANNEDVGIIQRQTGNPGGGDVMVVPPVTTEGDSADQWKTLAAFFGTLIATSIPIFWGMHDQHVKKGDKPILGVGDLLHSKRLDVFYGFVLLTMTFTGAYYSTLVSIWPMIMERQFWFRGPAFVAVCSFYLLYIYESKDKVPKFSFGTESRSIPSFWLLWLCSFSLIIAGIVIYGMGSVAIRRIRAAYRQN